MKTSVLEAVCPGSVLLLSDCETELVLETLSRQFSLTSPVASKLVDFLMSGRWDRAGSALTIPLPDQNSASSFFIFPSQVASFFSEFETLMTAITNFELYRDVRIFANIATQCGRVAAFIQPQTCPVNPNVPVGSFEPAIAQDPESARLIASFKAERVYPKLHKDSYMGEILVYCKSELIPSRSISNGERGVSFLIAYARIDDGSLVLALNPVPGCQFIPRDWLSATCFTPLTEGCDIKINPMQAELRFGAYRSQKGGDVFVKALVVDTALCVLSGFCTKS